MKIFIGYASEHLDAAQKIYDVLVPLGDDIWFDKVSLVGGDIWDSERSEAQTNADLVLHLCSREIVTRKGVVNREIRQTLRDAEDQPFGALHAVFIRLEDFALPPEFTHLHYIDFFKQDWIEKLNASIAKRRDQLSATVGTLSEKGPPPRDLQSGAEWKKFSDTGNSYNCTGSYIEFKGEGLYWEYLNSRIKSHVLGEYFEFISYWHDIDEEITGFEKSDFDINTEVFYVFNDMISLRFYNYSYFSRAVHPNHGVTSLNFLGRAAGHVDIKSLIKHDYSCAKRILKYCEKVISAYIEEEYEGESFFEGYNDTEEKVWKLLRYYNIDKKGITVNFSPYDILPYVFGSHEVFIPWSFMENDIDENIFRTIRTE
jgi:hypothetical protein